ncbi:hypothetical protein BT93_F2708 [Corymbia citriodora subsp. variegata]|nr:hypothetical protein BT93_F2708 [Corymbia citriodora subsp. variegata]
MDRQEKNPRPSHEMDHQETPPKSSHEMDHQETNPKPPHLRTVGSTHRRQLTTEDGKSESNLKSWVDDLTRELDQTKPTYDSGRSWTIHRVPRNLCQVRDIAFLPKIISIGPFHYGHEGLELMEEHKERFLMRLLGGKFDESEDDDQSFSPSSMGDDEKEKAPRLGDLVDAMKNLETRTRECYSEDFDASISSDKFVRMMVHDGCFVVELLRLYYKYDKAKGKPNGKPLAADPIFNARWMLTTLQRDLLKLENQLPYFVLQKLFKLTSRGQEKIPLEELIVTFFDPLSPRKTATSKLNRARTVDGKRQQYAHMLDVFRSTFLKTVRDKVNQNGWTPAPHLDHNNSLFSSHNDDVEKPLPREKQLIHFMSELQEAGVKLQKREGHDLLDIAFKGRTLHMPPFFIDNNSVPLFLNFIAYEQCNERAKPFFTNYFMFLDSLINSSDDVKILHEKEIINHALGSTDNVAALLDNLCREMVYDNDQCYLSNEMKEINKHCKTYYRSAYRRSLRTFIHKYFSSPWTILSLLAATVLLILTVLQTIYAIYSYYHPSS